MEIKTSTVVAMIASCMMMVQTLALPMAGSDQEADLSADKRPKYMDTKDLSYFKDLLLYSLDELISEGKVSSSVLAAPADNGLSSPAKRGRHLGICVQVSPSGGYKPMPCWKREGRR